MSSSGTEPESVRFPIDSETPRTEESRGGLVVEVEATAVGVATETGAAVVVVAEDAVHAAVVKANPNNRDKRVVLASGAVAMRYEPRRRHPTSEPEWVESFTMARRSKGGDYC